MIEQLLKMITCGYDGLVREIHFPSLNEASITISAMHQARGEWVNIRFAFSGLVEFTVRQQIHTSSIVLSNGIFYQKIKDVHYLDFSPYSEQMGSMDDLRMSDLFFAAKHIAYNIRPYSE